MFRSVHLQGTILILLIMLAPLALARDYIIYSIAQDIPMGNKNEIIKKNYYLNIGSGQGVKSGTEMNVYRWISQINPYNSNKRYTYQVKVGELTVIHTEKESSIALLKNLRKGNNVPLFQIDHFIIGDKVKVNID